MLFSNRREPLHFSIGHGMRRRTYRRLQSADSACVEVLATESEGREGNRGCARSVRFTVARGGSRTFGISSILPESRSAISVFARCEQNDVRSRTREGRRSGGTITCPGRAVSFPTTTTCMSERVDGRKTRSPAVRLTEEENQRRLRRRSREGEGSGGGPKGAR